MYCALIDCNQPMMTAVQVQWFSSVYSAHKDLDRFWKEGQMRGAVAQW